MSKVDFKQMLRGTFTVNWKIETFFSFSVVLKLHYDVIYLIYH